MRSGGFIIVAIDCSGGGGVGVGVGGGGGDGGGLWID